MVSVMKRSQIALIWAIWSASVLFFAAAAEHLPAAHSNPWPAALARITPPLARWDAGWYALIATEGYSLDPQRLQNDVDFYPLYPLAVRASMAISPFSLFWTGTVFSLLCLLVALLLLADLVKEWLGPESVFPTTACLLAFPTAFYFAAFYTESLFLLCAVAAFWSARRGKWWLTFLAGVAASLTRLNGLVLAVPLAWIAWEAWKRRATDVGTAGLLGTAGCVIGAVLYPTYLWRRWGDPLLYIHRRSTGAWAQRPEAPWKLIRDVGSEAWANLWKPPSDGRLNFFLKLVSILLFLLITLALFRKGRIPEALYLGVSLLLLLCSGTIDAAHRYVLVLFPGFAMIGEWLRPRRALAFGLMFLSIGLQVVLLIRYVEWIYVA
jgi:Gpi18-like mannosyltransferase